MKEKEENTESPVLVQCKVKVVTVMVIWSYLC